MSEAHSEASADTATQTNTRRTRRPTLKYLHENGPVARDALSWEPHDADPEYGVRTLELTDAGKLVTDHHVRDQTPVFYFPDHSPFDVLRTYLDANPGIADVVYKTTLHDQLPEKFADAIDYLDSVYEFTKQRCTDTGTGRGVNENGNGKTCPNCGETVWYPYYPEHAAGIACDPTAVDADANDG